MYSRQHLVLRRYLYLVRHDGLATRPSRDARAHHLSTRYVTPQDPLKLDFTNNRWQENKKSLSSDEETDECSESSDEEGTVPEPLLEEHGDHWDEVIDYRPTWEDWEWPGEDWWSTHVAMPETSVSNDALYAETDTQHWLSVFSTLRPQNCHLLKGPDVYERRYPIPTIPVFKDSSTGDEYQLTLPFQSALTEVLCPALSILEPAVPRNDNPLIRVRYRLSPSSAGDSDNATQAKSLPRFCIPLGTLLVRTTARYPVHFGSTQPLTEATDYKVMLDAESESLPVWLACSRRLLKERVTETNYSIPSLPIFRGEMQTEDECGYDMACILESVHQLGQYGADEQRFKEACELVRRTRAIADPSQVLAVDLQPKWEELTGAGRAATASAVDGQPVTEADAKASVKVFEKPKEDGDKTTEVGDGTKQEV